MKIFQLLMSTTLPKFTGSKEELLQTAAVALVHTALSNPGKKIRTQIFSGLVATILDDSSISPSDVDIRGQRLIREFGAIPDYYGDVRKDCGDIFYYFDPYGPSGQRAIELARASLEPKVKLLSLTEDKPKDENLASLVKQWELPDEVHAHALNSAFVYLSEEPTWKHGMATEMRDALIHLAAELKVHQGRGPQGIQNARYKAISKSKLPDHLLLKAFDIYQKVSLG